MLRDLSKFLKVDEEKENAIQDLLFKSQHTMLRSKKLVFAEERMEMCENLEFAPFTKFCPKCHREYPMDENVCYECLVALKDLSEKTPIHDIESKPIFRFSGENSLDDFESIFCESNVEKVNEFNINMNDLEKIIRNIKLTSLRNLDELINDNYVDLNGITILEKVLLFTKTFVNVEYKSYGQQLGYFEFETVTIDDRQTASLQITTMIHELSHFLLKEILVGVLCKLLDCASNRFIDVIVTYVLAYSNFTQLIDEYSAHCCEGRFTVYGYQDYSSFLNIIAQMDGEMSRDEIEITKSIGNTFANAIKDILEIFIDRDLREDIKSNFLNYHYESPNYEMLKLENCEMLTDEGFLKAIWLIISEGFAAAGENLEILNDYLEEVK